MSTHDAERAAPPQGFLQRLFFFFFRSSDPEREKKRLLKEIARDLKRLKTRRFQPKGKLAGPALAKFFYEFYKTLGPAHLLLSHAEASNVLKSILVESSLSESQLEIKKQLSEESIRDRAKESPSKALVDKLKNELKSFFSFFDINRINEINNLYRHLYSMLNLIKFDYYFLLKKFDSHLQENNFNYNPHFEAISGQYVVDELKDFLEIAPTIDPNIKWEQIMEVFKEYRGVEVIAQNSWKKLLQSIRQIRKTEELEMIVRLIDEDPSYAPTVRLKRENIVESYLSKLKMNTELTIQKIVQERRKKRLDELALQIFGTASVSRLQHYTEKANMLFAKKKLSGYTQVTPLNYLKAFLLDYVKKDVRQVVDLLLIPGKWTDNTASQMLSEAFHQLLKISDEIVRFDEALAEDGEHGKKILSGMYRAERDKLMLHSLRQLINKINEHAQSMIMKSGQQCINLGNVLKTAYEDYIQKHPKLIMNWRELEGHSERDLKSVLTSVYKQLYYFVQLLKSFA